jgi:hypothetical protein
MKLRSLGILLAVSVALLVTLACGSGDNTTGSATPANSASSSVVDQALKDYFQQLSTILTHADDQSSQLQSQYPSAGSDPDQARQYLSQFLGIITNALSAIKNLGAPSTVKDQHDTLVSALEDLLTADTSQSKDIQSINSASDLKVYFDNHQSDNNAKTNRATAACSSLQTVADNNNVGASLNCNGAASPAPSPTMH